MDTTRYGGGDRRVCETARMLDRGVLVLAFLAASGCRREDGARPAPVVDAGAIVVDAASAATVDAPHDAGLEDAVRHTDADADSDPATRDPYSGLPDLDGDALVSVSQRFVGFTKD